MRAIGVDVGGSGVRAQLLEAGRQRSARLPAALPRDDGRIAVDRLARLITRCVEEAAVDWPATETTAICVGMSGLPDILDEPERLARAIGSALCAERVVLTSDALTAHAGALGLAGGTIVAAGTGVVALGTDLDARWNRGDGWGLLLGDEGGGAWVGQQGLLAALRAADGRPGGSAALHERMCERFGGSAELVHAVYGEQLPTFLFGGFAPEVSAAAHAGDPVALGIWAEAGRRLADTAFAASAGLAPRFSWSGRLFDAGELVLAPFSRRLRTLCPDAVLAPPIGTAADGAVLIAQRSLSAPIGAGTAHARYVTM